MVLTSSLGGVIRGPNVALLLNSAQYQRLSTHTHTHIYISHT